MQLFAHRGISAHYLENTLPAIKASLVANVDGIEIDIHQVENEYLVYHDFSLAKYGKEHLLLEDMTVAELRDVKLKDNLQVPFIQEILDLVNGQCVLNLEIKQCKDLEPLLDIVTDYIYRSNGQIIISSFNHPLVKQFQAMIRDTRLVNNIRFAALIAHLPIDLANYASKMEVDIAAIDIGLVNKEFVEDAHKHHLEVYSYTINTVELFARAKEMKINGVFTNDPELLKKHI